MEKYLPIGSVIMLENGKKRLMITGYKPIIKTEIDEKKYDYSGCLFPEGVLEPDRMLLFNHDKIEFVYYYGLIDDEQKEFMKRVLEDDLEKNADLELPNLKNELTNVEILQTNE